MQKGDEILDKGISKMIYLVVKRLFDIVVSLCALVFVVPLTFVIWLVDSFGENKGPVFYKQRRIGKDHRPFYIYKYRSMIVDADKKLKEDKALYALYVK